MKTTAIGMIPDAALPQLPPGGLLERRRRDRAAHADDHEANAEAIQLRKKDALSDASPRASTRAPAIRA